VWLCCRDCDKVEENKQDDEGKEGTYDGSSGMFTSGFSSKTIEDTQSKRYREEHSDISDESNFDTRIAAGRSHRR
jgi:hypothetical protein